MLCDSTSPLLKNVSVKMPDSLRKLIARMHAAKNRRILAPNALPVKRLSAEEKKMGPKKLCGLMKPRRNRISLRHSTPKNFENRTPSRVYDNSPVLDQLSVDLEKSIIDSTQNDVGTPLKAFAESTNTPKSPANGYKTNISSTPRKNSFTYPSELTTEADSDGENVAVKFKPSATVDQESSLRVGNTDQNVEPEDYENVKTNGDSSGIDSTVVITNEASPINMNTIAAENVSMTPSGRRTVHKIDFPGTPVNYPPLDTAAIKSSLKTKSCGIKKWVTFNETVQAESQIQFINDFSAERRQTNDSKSEKMRIDIQPVFVDDFYTHQSHCKQVVTEKSELTQISSQTNFVDDLYADSPKRNDTKSENEDNSSAGNKVQNMINVLRRIK